MFVNNAAGVEKVVDLLAGFVRFWAENRSSVPAWIKQDLAVRQARADWLYEFHTQNRIPAGEVSWYDLNEEAEAIRSVEDAFMAAEWEAERAAAEVVRREAEARAQAAQAAPRTWPARCSTPAPAFRCNTLRTKAARRH